MHLVKNFGIDLLIFGDQLSPTKYSLCNYVTTTLRSANRFIETLARKCLRQSLWIDVHAHILASKEDDSILKFWVVEQQKRDFLKSRQKDDSWRSIFGWIASTNERQNIYVLLKRKFALSSSSSTSTATSLPRFERTYLNAITPSGLLAHMHPKTLAIGG